MTDRTYEGRHRAVVGRHRAPPPPGRPRMRVALAGGALLAVPGSLAFTDVASAAVADRAVLGAIAHCESGGNPQASNGTHFGLFQFDLPTWRSVGGSGNPLNATAAEQIQRAGLLLDARGTQPWLATQPCWSARAGGPVQVRGVAASKPAPVVAVKPKPRAVVAARTAPRRAPVALSHASIRVKAGDTLSSIARAHHIRVAQLHGYRSGCPNLIFPGERLTIR